MPLLIDGRRVRLPQSAGDLVRAHPPLEESLHPVHARAGTWGRECEQWEPAVPLAAEPARGASTSPLAWEARAEPLERARLLRGQSVQQVGPQGLLYVQQRELAVTSPKDGSISILGSDDATTCHIVVLRHTGNGATCLTHCDGTDTKAEVPLIMNSIKSFSDHAQSGRLEVHLVGGFSDDRQLSQKLTHQLLSEFDKQEDDIHLVTLCVTELNDREENENHFPIIYGIAVNIKTAEIYRATFQDRGPEEELRAARALAGGPMISIYDAKTEQLQIGPYSWMPFPHVDFWLQQDDKQILEHLNFSETF
ncbi:protein N-terminal asparagine amidohydrolase isoform X3 [Sciurus carolinensis]|uniref:protein N-terminal asparagine amidohydrolase isoform X3 n=1 Tax=Sciurus carolinensis TaxID=30640 RepID=UPI001FB4A6E1|nr:protein N-terminal asparagine amidohydrolase isoform X3 [Sciurus carolinensis]